MKGRFKSQALLNQQTLLATMAYVDPNPVRAGVAETQEDSDYTLIQERINAVPDHDTPAETPFTATEQKKTDKPLVEKSSQNPASRAADALRCHRQNLIGNHFRLSRVSGTG